MRKVFGLKRLEAVRGMFILMLLSMLAVTPVQLRAAEGIFGGDNYMSRYAYADLAQKVLPSVVTVYVKRDLTKSLNPRQKKQYEQQKKQMDELRRYFGGPNSPFPFSIPSPDSDDEGMIVKGSGSGVIVSNDGYVVTNWHVVGDKEDQTEIRVVLSNDVELTGKDVKLIASSQLSDLALLKISRTGLTTIKFGDSDKVRIGERVAAVGSPLELKQTITQGIISAKHRALGTGLSDMIQTDAVINPGSSGGALVNLDGELIGINRMIATPSRSGFWEGYGFAIPSNDVKYFVDDVLKHGQVRYGYIGINMVPETEDSSKLRESLGLSKDMKGVLVQGVNSGTPAAKGGLEQGDLITAVDDQKVETTGDLLRYVARKPIGADIKLSIMRPGEDVSPRKMTLNVKVAQRPDEATLKGGKSHEEEEEMPKEDSGNKLGIRVEPYKDNGRTGLKITEVDPGSPGEKAGLKPGDVLLKLNFIPLKTPADLQKALKARRDNKPQNLSFLRDGRQNLTVIE